MRRRDLLRSSLGAGLGATIGSLLGLPRIARAQGTRTLRFVPQADAAILDPMITTSFVAILTPSRPQRLCISGDR
jgi:peptide/nickel transport system substrate-binding protein